MEKLYTVKEAAEHLRVSRAKIYLLIQAGKLSPVKLDKKTLFKESELARFIDSLEG